MQLVTGFSYFIQVLLLMHTADLIKNLFYTDLLTMYQVSYWTGQKKKKSLVSHPYKQYEHCGTAVLISVDVWKFMQAVSSALQQAQKNISEIQHVELGMNACLRNKLCTVHYLLSAYHVAFELLIAFMPSVLVFVCSFTTGSAGQTHH